MAGQSGSLFVSREELLAGLCSGALKVEISVPGFAAYGSPREPWNFARRKLPFNFIHLPKRGRLKMQVGSSEIVAGPGCFLWVSAGVEHDMAQSDVRQPMVMYHLRVMIRTQTGQSCRPLEDMFLLPHALPLHRLFESWFSDQFLASSHAGPISQGLILQAFGQLFVGLERSVGGRRLTAVHQQRLQRFCEEHLRDAPTPRRLAAYLGLSPPYLTRLFHAAFGKSPKTWLVDERMRVASVQLVESNLPVTTIGQNLGYADVYSFSRQFSRSLGCSPRAFRMQHRS